jgi:hypothetical protein
MRKYIVAAAVVLASTGAYALDIQNQDGADLKVTVFPQDSGPVSFTLKAGEAKKNACSKTICEVMLGTESGEWVATSNMTEKVVIKGGKLQVQ